MSDQAAYAKFEDGWEPTGEVSKDGLPQQRLVTIIRLSKPPFLDVRRPAEESDIEHYDQPYKLYLKLKAGRDLDAIEGYPIVLWPALSRAEAEQCVGAGILTVEELAKHAGRTNAKAPAGILQLAARAKRMLDLQKAGGKLEPVVEQLRQEREQLKEQVAELGTQLSAANAMINTLQMRLSGIGTLLPEHARPAA